MSDEVSTGQDIAALALLGTAAYGAYGVIEGFSTTKMAQAGLLGLTTNQSVKYLSPEETSARLLDAAERQFCIISAGRSLQDSDKSSEEFGVLADGFTKVRILLRRELSRDFPNYSELVASYANALEDKSEAVAALEKGNNIVARARLSLAELREKVKGCFVL